MGVYPQKQKTEDEKLLTELHETKLLKNEFGIQKDDINCFKFNVNKVIQICSLYVLLYINSTVWES